LNVSTDTIAVVALGIGLSASCGFRVFVPLLVASVAANLGLIPLQQSFEWLGSWPAIVCFTVATFAEILAYYIPFVDNLLDSIATPLAIGAGSLLMTSVLPVDENMLKWIIGIIVGGGMAAGIQTGSVITRLASSKFTAGVGNPVVATGEHAAAFGTSIMALLAPVFVACLAILLIVFVLTKIGKRLR
jgi:hypothetical protein